MFHGYGDAVRKRARNERQTSPPEIVSAAVKHNGELDMSDVRVRLRVGSAGRNGALLVPPTAAPVNRHTLGIDMNDVLFYDTKKFHHDPMGLKPIPVSSSLAGLAPSGLEPVLDEVAVLEVPAGLVMPVQAFRAKVAWAVRASAFYHRYRLAGIAHQDRHIHQDPSKSVVTSDDGPAVLTGGSYSIYNTGPEIINHGEPVFACFPTESPHDGAAVHPHSKGKVVLSTMGISDPTKFADMELARIALVTILYVNNPGDAFRQNLRNLCGPQHEILAVAVNNAANLGNLYGVLTGMQGVAANVNVQAARAAFRMASYLFLESRNRCVGTAMGTASQGGSLAIHIGKA